MIHKWYRGHDGNQKATDNFGIIWITDDPEYAQLYADEYGNEGVVSVLYIDESKLKYADTYYDDNFDVWFPDMAKVKEYQKEGYNCYSFPVSIDGLDCDCIALFDESAIVKIEQLNTNNENTMKSTIKLTESELKGMIEESVKRVLSELDWKTYMNAARKRSKQGHSMKSHDLASYAKEKFNQQHGYEDDDSRVGWDDLTGVSRRDKNVFNRTYREFIDDDGKHKSMTVGGWNDQCDVKRNPNDPNPHLQKAHQEYTDYIDGNYEYSQENGWKKNKPQ